MLHEKLKGINLLEFKSNFLKQKTLDDLKRELEEKKYQVNELSSHNFLHQLKLCEKILIDIEHSDILNNNSMIQIIHGDFTPDNIIFDNNQVKAIIDFELVRINSKLQDIGRIILSTSFSNSKFDVLKIKSFIKGYSSICKIDYSDVINSLKIVWVNEFSIWIQDRYFKNYNPPKVEKFIDEIVWISENWFDLQNKIEGY
jgi:Ser/Thr protein kinase RdoA (MazF antagonist)